MRFVIFVMAMLLCILLVMAYALCVMAHDADERAEKMYRKWKESANKTARAVWLDGDYNEIGGGKDDD